MGTFVLLIVVHTASDVLNPSLWIYDVYTYFEEDVGDPGLKSDGPFCEPSLFVFVMEIK